MMPLGAICESAWNLSLMELGDLVNDYELDHEVLDHVDIGSLEWLAADQRKWALESAPLDADQIEWLEGHIGRPIGEVLPEMAGMIGGFWLVCVDGIAGSAVDVDGGRAVQVLEWEEIL